ncbi:MAG: hypothetical protein LBE27_08190, partial [Deltaproteobacteria bacterium]|nr:hypothetical protein [Deltaproteobacteria bacterium]
MAIQLILTTLGSAAFFLLVTLSLCFWGRLILKLFGVKNNIGYGDPLPLVASVASMCVIFRYLYYLTVKFDLFYSCIFILGIMGFLAEMILFIMRTVKSKREKTDIIHYLLERHISIMIGAITCLSFSAYLALIWPSRAMEPWLSVNIDYYFWIGLADFWRGSFDSNSTAGTNIFYWALDSYGTSIFFGFFSSAKGTLTYMAIPYFLVSLLSWIGICVYKIIRSAFSLPLVMAILLTLGLVCGNFFNLLTLYGFVGHLVGLLGFLTCLTVVFSIDSNATVKDYFVNIFFPVLYLFVCYQAVFIVFTSMVFFTMILVTLLNNIDNYKNIVRYFSNAIKVSFIKIILPVVAACVILPQTAAFIFLRTISASRQQEGFPLELIDPTFFSGIPLFNNDLALMQTNSSFISYAFYFLAIILLALYVTSKNNSLLSAINKKKIIALTILLITCCIVYILYFFIKGQMYLVWKYAAYSILPLSFVASALLFSTLYRFVRGNQCLFAIISSIVVGIMIFFPILAIKSPFYGKIGINTHLKSLTPLIIMLSEINKLNQDKSTIIIDYVTGPKTMAAAIITFPTNKKIYLPHGMYFFKRNNDYFKVFDENTVLYSDKEYVGIYNSYYTLVKDEKMFTYDLDELNKIGAVAYVGVKEYSSYAWKNQIKVKVLVPLHMRGKNIKLKIDVQVDNADEFPNCQNFRVTLPESETIV